MDLDSFEQLAATQRAVRMVDTTRPVDDAIVERLLRVATHAPNGGNRQEWRFIVVRDQDVKARLGAIYDDLADTLYHNADRRTRWEDVPVLIAVCSVPREGPVSPATSPAGASIFPAVQNLLLAAHALGLGSVLTTLWKRREPEVRAILELPDGVELHAILPIGWRDRAYGRNRRRPVREVAYRDRFGRAW